MFLSIISDQSACLSTAGDVIWRQESEARGKKDAFDMIWVDKMAHRLQGEYRSCLKVSVQGRLQK